MNPQLIGAENVTGTYIFDIRTSNRTLKLNRFFWKLIAQDWRERFAAEPEALMTEAGLTEREKELVRNKDWLGLIQHGANFFVLEKFARFTKTTNLHVYAEFRGESFEDFMKTRRVPDAR